MKTGVSKWCVGVLLLLCVAVTGAAQAVPGQGLQKAVKFPEYDRQTGRLKSLLSGDTATPSAEGEVLVTGVRLETYTYEGGRQIVDLIIETPKCLFNLRSRVASSTDRMKAFRADGAATLEGRGFEWSQKTSLLLIQSDVRSVLLSGFTLSAAERQK